MLAGHPWRAAHLTAAQKAWAPALCGGRPPHFSCQDRAVQLARKLHPGLTTGGPTHGALRSPAGLHYIRAHTSDDIPTLLPSDSRHCMSATQPASGECSTCAPAGGRLLQSAAHKTLPQDPAGCWLLQPAGACRGVWTGGLQQPAPSRGAGSDGALLPAGAWQGGGPEADALADGRAQGPLPPGAGHPVQAHAHAGGAARRCRRPLLHAAWCQTCVRIRCLGPVQAHVHLSWVHPGCEAPA